MAFSTLSGFATSRGDTTLDPRLLDILKTAAQAYGLDVQATSGVAGRSTGTKNHPGGYAIDVQLVDPSTGRVLPNYHEDLPNSFPAYEKFAQTARVVQQQKYPELNDVFRWGGYFRGGVNPADLMHFDINPSLHGAMAGGSWDSGINPSFAKSIGVTSYNPGLGSLDGRRYVAAIQQSMHGGPLPPMNIPQVGTALDVIDRVVPRPMPSQIASAYAPVAPLARAPIPALPTQAMIASRMATNPTGRLPAGFDPMLLDNPGAPPLSGIQPASPPVPMPGRPAALMDAAPVLAPIPMPGRPPALSQAALQTPQRLPAPSAPPPPAPHLVQLASGKMIAPGIYDQGGHSVRVSDNGSGQAVVERIRSPMSVPGVFDPLREANANTLAGGMIRSMLPQVASNAVAGFVPTVDRAKTAALGAISNFGAQAQNFGGGLLGGLFGGGVPASRGLLAAALPIAGRAAPIAPVPLPRPLVLSIPSGGGGNGGGTHWDPGSGSWVGGGQ